MVGEITAFVVLGILDRTGLFELKPPFVLRRRGEFPDCVALLEDCKLSRFPTGNSSRYVSLCRLTGLAWAVWAIMATFACYAGVSITYHLIYSGHENVFRDMGAHSLVAVSAFASQTQITCLGFWCAAAALAVLATVYYSTLLGSCRESDLTLRADMQKNRRTTVSKAS